jgi:hypothetical protein
MQEQYSMLPSDVQRALRDAGCQIHQSDAIVSDNKTQNLWTVIFAAGTEKCRCFLWMPERSERQMYRLPTGDVLIESNDENPYRSLYILDADKQEKYGLSLKIEDSERYPIITEKDGIKEILVSGWQRPAGAVFLDGFGTGRPGFKPVRVLFTYHSDGTHEIYIFSLEDEINETTKNYQHLDVSSKKRQGQDPDLKYHVFSSGLDFDLKETYGIDLNGNFVHE